MMKQLFNVKLLGAVLLSAFVMIAVSNFNSINAQTISAMEVDEAQSSNPLDLEDLREDLARVIQSVEDNTDYTHEQQEARIVMYDNVWLFAKRGVSVEESIYASINKAEEYVNKLPNPDNVDLDAMLQEAKNNLL